MSFVKIAKSVAGSLSKMLPCGCSDSVTIAPMSMMAKFVRERDVIKYEEPQTGLRQRDIPLADLAVLKEKDSDVMEVRETETQLQVKPKMTRPRIHVETEPVIHL